MFGKKKLSVMTLCALILISFSGLAATPGTEINEKIEIKKGEKIERQGQIDKSQNAYVYLIHAEKGQNINLAAVFRDNVTPDSVFRDKFTPSVEIRGPYKSDDKDSSIVGAAKDGKLSASIKESGDYLIVVSRPTAKDGGDDGGEQAIYPYKLLVWMK